MRSSTSAPATKTPRPRSRRGYRTTPPARQAQMPPARHQLAAPYCPAAQGTIPAAVPGSDELHQRLGRSPTTAELAEQLDMDEEEVLDGLAAGAAAMRCRWTSQSATNSTVHSASWWSRRQPGRSRRT